jgi:hypothetical protein
MPQPCAVWLADDVDSDKIIDYAIMSLSISGYEEYRLFSVTQLESSTPAILGLLGLRKHRSSVD